MIVIGIIIAVFILFLVATDINKMANDGTDKE